jgi:hypothetical protein
VPAAPSCDAILKGSTMGAQRTTFEKLQRDRAKKAKQAAKREGRLNKDDAAVEEEAPVLVPEGGELSAGELLQLIEQIHRQFENKQIDFEEFEERKADLMARLPID